MPVRMAEYGICSGHWVAVIWDQTSSLEEVKKLVVGLQSAVGAGGHVAVENVERLILSAHKESSFDVLVSGVLPGSAVVHTSETLEEMARILKPGGKFHLAEPVVTTSENIKPRSKSKLSSALKLSGLVEITEVQNEVLASEEAATVKQLLGYQGDDLVRVQMSAKKPNFEVGSSAQLKLSFAKKSTHAEKPLVDPNAAKLWTLSANDMNDDDVVSFANFIDRWLAKLTILR
nr:PREDICTED: anamorsin [Latimeria chalumnae]|eukprot:XP_014346552.1 PREDICTED: anamorsin [Latimeria chalumnae]